MKEREKEMGDGGEREDEKEWKGQRK
jgi:hypothetical protein